MRDRLRMSGERKREATRVHRTDPLLLVCMRGAACMRLAARGMEKRGGGGGRADVKIEHMNQRALNVPVSV